jgi:pimeloyl-ACP methyl ester carboxylesterase
MAYADLNGFRMFYQDGGSGDALVFIHGGIASFARTLKNPDEYGWGGTDELFASHFRYITYDRRGCRLSSCPEGGYELENQAEDLRALLDHLGIERTHLVASSAGGPIGIVFAATYPRTTQALVLAGTALRLFPEDDPASAIVRQQVASLDANGPEAAFALRPAGVEASLDVLWSEEEARAKGELGPWRAEQEEYARRAALAPHDERVRRYAAELRSAQAFITCDVERYARRVSAPTLILHGTDDREVYFPWAEAMARVMSGAIFRRFDGGHHSLLYYSDEAREETISFLRAQ